jgi:hypothetical protein
LLDQFLALQSVNRVTNDRAFIADKACDLLNAHKTYPAAVDEIQYIPFTEERNTHAL